MERKMKQEILEEEKFAEGLDEGARMHCTRRRLLAESDGPKLEEHPIYRVNSFLRKGNESCYEPIATSIGPYHHGKKHLLDMETHKNRYRCDLLSRNKNVRFEHLVSMMKESEQQVRGCYPEIIDLQSNAFVEMMLLDGCFIVEFLLKLKSGGNGDDLFVGPSWRMGTLLCHDLFLLENQLPFFLLQKIFEVVKPEVTDPSALMRLSLETFKFIWLATTIKEEKHVLSDPKDVHHLLHLLYLQFILTIKAASFAKQPQDSNIQIPVEEDTSWMPGVTQLEEAGVKFKASSSNLLNIKFSKGELIIPTITVSDDTEAQLRNLVAFEQSRHPSNLHNITSFHGYYFTYYVLFLNHLIKTSKDVEILHEKGLLRRHLADNEEVAQLFNKLTNGFLIWVSENYLGDTIKRINHYTSKKIPKWRASLMRDYFYNPWAFLSFIAAIVALTLSATSTTFSIISFFKHLHQPK